VDKRVVGRVGKLASWVLVDTRSRENKNKLASRVSAKRFVSNKARGFGSRIASLGFKRLVGGKAGRFDIRRFEDGSLKAKKLAGSKARGFEMGCFRIASLGFKRLVGDKAGRFGIRRFEDGSPKANNLPGAFILVFRGGRLA
jgi:hypothetical protein